MCTRSICLTASFSLLALATSVSADLVGHWPLDGNADDISANGYDGVAAGGVTYAAGVLGSAADFNGSDALIDCGDVPLGDTGALSIACWVRPRNIAQNWAGYVSKWTLDNSQRTFWLGQHSTDGWLRFGIYPGGPTAETFVDSGQVILANEEWTHVTCTYDGNIQRIYADAVEVVASPERNAAVVDRGGNLRFGIVASANWFNGLIDDVRIYNRALAPGELHTVMMGEAYPQALALTPADGSMVETTALVLQWRPGDFAVSHDVYFGESFDEVDRAAPGEATFQGSQTDARFSVTNLTPGGTYYWRIDEINEVDPNSPWRGDVWSFTTANFIIVLIVDDFESYSDDMEPDAAIFQVWVDGIENGTGSVVGYFESENGTFGETRIVHSGRQSMPLFYDNDGSTVWADNGASFYSECVRTWRDSQDWTIQDADAVTLYVRGETSNSSEPLYVAIEDSSGRIAVVEHPDADALLTTEWREWHIALADLQVVGVDVAAVQKMYIGVGDRDTPQPGGEGVVYIDDIWVTKRMP